MPARQLHFVKDSFYHIFNRGSEKRTIFLSQRDYIKFLERIRENSKKYEVEILCYCLMPNHFHFLLRQITDVSVAQFMNALQLGHAKYFNTKYERVGPLFQGRFKAKCIESDEYLLQLSGYIHKNPIADLTDSGNPSDSRNLVRILRDFSYSSYREYIGLERPSITSQSFIQNYFSKTNPSLTYESFVENFRPDLEALAPLLASI